ncbi:MAG TPA: hypothetical protein VFU71_13400 [Burkholderiaceae bacterium]|nr:hypothetical protein [Burkholderiaceae bacterium]
MLKIFITAALTLALAACGSIAPGVAAVANGGQLKDTIGKSYRLVIHERPELGPLIDQETLDSGDQIMKHVGGLGTAQSSYAGIYGKQEEQARVVYFLVDSKGLVKDWATKSYKAGSADCWVGICGNQKYVPIPADELDQMVKTSSGTTLAAWRHAPY